MPEKCPVCGRYLQNGQDSKQKIEYPPDKLQEFEEGLITLEQLNEHAIIYYMRPRLCINPNCREFAGDPNDAYEEQVFVYSNREPETQKRIKVDMSNPRKVVKWEKIIDN
jgi:hypothetical protein